MADRAQAATRRSRSPPPEPVGRPRKAVLACYQAKQGCSRPYVTLPLPMLSETSYFCGLLSLSRLSISGSTNSDHNIVHVRICFCGVVWVLILIPTQIAQARLARAFAQGGTVPESYWRLGRRWAIWETIATVLPGEHLSHGGEALSPSISAPNRCREGSGYRNDCTSAQHRECHLKRVGWQTC